MAGRDTTKAAMKMKLSTTADMGVRPAVRGVDLAAIGPALLTLGALVLWLATLKRIDPHSVGDLGLAPSLPATAYVSLVGVIASFCLTLRQKPLRLPLLLLHCGVLIFMLYGVTTLVEEEPRFAVTWLHVGFAESIARTGRVFPELDARFSWPGFFTMTALVTQIAGLADALPLTAWAPVYFNLLYLGPLLIIMRSATRDARLIWLAVWFFFLTNWIGQDYFAPQALHYFLYLVIVAILLTWFKTANPRVLLEHQRWRRFGRLARLANRLSPILAPPDLPNMPARPWQRGGLLAIVLVLFAIIVSSHQLTPFSILMAVAALVVFQRCSARSLPLLMAVMIGTWISYMTVAFLSGHLDMVAGHFGEVKNTVSANVTDRMQGSRGHMIVVYGRIAMTLFVWGLGALGGIRRLRHGHWDLTLALLAGTPFMLMGMQAYGGELLLRVYLFALPFMCFFAAALFYPADGVGSSWRATAAVTLMSLALLGGFVFCRYGNERMDYMTHQEVDAVRYLYGVARPGSLLVAASPNLAWRFRDNEKFDYAPISDVVLVGDIDGVVRIMSNKKYSTAYLVMTRSQGAYAALFSNLSAENWARFKRDVVVSSKFTVIYQNDEALIATLAPGVKGAQP